LFTAGGPFFGSCPSLATIFFAAAANISLFFDLRRSDTALSAQNIDPQGLAGKILLNKELVAVLAILLGAADFVLRIFPILHCGFFSVKVVRHMFWVLSCGKTRKTA